MSGHEWCLHYSKIDHGEHGFEHRCSLGVDIVALGGGRCGIRWTMPCNTDVVDGWSKAECARRLTPTEEVYRRAKLVREERVDASE